MPKDNSTAGTTLSVLASVRRKRGTVVGLFVVAVAGLAGCHEYRDLVHDRFRAEQDCHAPVDVVELGASGYRAAGCGKEAVYVCRGGACEQDSIREVGGGEEPVGSRQVGQRCRSHTECAAGLFCDPTRHVCSPS